MQLELWARIPGFGEEVLVMATNPETTDSQEWFIATSEVSHAYWLIKTQICLINEWISMSPFSKLFVWDPSAQNFSRFLHETLIDISQVKAHSFFTSRSGVLLSCYFYLQRYKDIVRYIVTVSVLLFESSFTVKIFTRRPISTDEVFRPLK